jgi:hypothetical protein
MTRGGTAIMPAYNFKERFANVVLDGTKSQTIRPPRKRPTRVGETLYLYTGMRTKNCRLLREAVCSSIVSIRIATELIVMGDIFLSDDAANDLAIADGFENASQLIDFFETQYGLPFEGELIRW